jgi:hypothetical protein
VCDPCQTIWYPVNGVEVSDFYTPRYFDPVHNPAAIYSFTGTLTRPLEILEGGYLTWIDPTDSALYQLQGGDDEPVLVADVLTLASSSMPLRTVVDSSPISPRVTRASLTPASSAAAAQGSAGAVRDAAQVNAVRTAEAFLSLAAEAETWD